MFDQSLSMVESLTLTEANEVCAFATSWTSLLGVILIGWIVLGRFTIVPGFSLFVDKCLYYGSRSPKAFITLSWNVRKGLMVLDWLFP